MSGSKEPVRVARQYVRNGRPGSRGQRDVEHDLTGRVRVTIAAVDREVEAAPSIFVAGAAVGEGRGTETSRLSARDGAEGVCAVDVDGNAPAITQKVLVCRTEGVKRGRHGRGNRPIHGDRRVWRRERK